jgi:hypothetical protein
MKAAIWTAAGLGIMVILFLGVAAWDARDVLPPDETALAIKMLGKECPYPTARMIARNRIAETFEIDLSCEGDHFDIQYADHAVKITPR